MNSDRCIDKLVRLYGTRAAIAKLLAPLTGRGQMTRANVSKWSRQGYIPPEWALATSRLSNGQFSVEDVLLEHARAVVALRLGRTPKREKTLSVQTVRTT